MTDHVIGGIYYAAILIGMLVLLKNYRQPPPAI